MKSLGLDAELISSISPNKIATYLEYKGWRKEKEVEGIASLWSYMKDNKNISVLLPLDSDFSDYEIKIEELVTMLSRVEERPKTEILKILENTSLIAKRNCREVIDLKIDKYEVSVKEIGAVLKSLQDLFDSIVTLKNQTTEKRFEKEAIKSELELSLLDTFQDSFGIRVGLPVHRQPNLFNAPIEESVESFMKLIIASSSDNSESLRSEIKKIQGEPLIKFKSLIKHLMELESDLVLEWGSVNPEKGGIVSFPFHKIVQAFEIVSKADLEKWV